MDGLPPVLSGEKCFTASTESSLTRMTLRLEKKPCFVNVVFDFGRTSQLVVHIYVRTWNWKGFSRDAWVLLASWMWKGLYLLASYHSVVLWIICEADRNANVEHGEESGRKHIRPDAHERDDSTDVQKNAKIWTDLAGPVFAHISLCSYWSILIVQTKMVRCSKIVCSTFFSSLLKVLRTILQCGCEKPSTFEYVVWSNWAKIVVHASFWFWAKGFRSLDKWKIRDAVVLLDYSVLREV